MNTADGGLVVAISELCRNDTSSTCRSTTRIESVFNDMSPLSSEINTLLSLTVTAVSANL